MTPAQGSPALVDEAAKLVIIPERTTPAAFTGMLAAWAGGVSYPSGTAFVGTGQQVAGVSPLGREMPYTVVVRGDLDGDGRVDAVDAQLLLRALEGQDIGLPEAVFHAAADGLDAQALFDRGME